MEIRLLETAKEDLREGWHFYERNSAGLGEYFLDCIQADVRSLQLYAGIHEMAEGFHRMLVKRFPFAVYYLIEDECVDIYAILDCRRDPEWIVKRLHSSRAKR
ncbi:MAG: type II toxin-antitoxin system RelE/ParE family toxin [Planctomycetes bacterium]|nr:type II toxin-antitoxin system RelE/ParE family toxin [Planctomycetota bacterium]